MRLGVILDKLQTIATAKIPYPIGIGTTAVEMDNHDGTSAGSEGLLNEAVVNLQRRDVGLDENGCETVLGDGKDGGDIGVGRHDDFVAVAQASKFLIGSQDECQRIEAVGATHAVLRSNICSIVFLEASRCLASKVPPTLQHLVGSMLVGLVNPFQV
jgi:hypothetical protein